MTYRFARDPFARTVRTRRVALTRRAARSGRVECHNCGQTDRTMYIYGIETDGGTRSEDGKRFCSVGCRDAYYGN